MHYLSTRGFAATPHFSEILLGGLAPDGGLYLPAQYPQVSASELDTWRSLSYANLAFEILKKFIQIEIILVPEHLLNSKSLWKAPFIMSFCHKYAFDKACLNGSTISFLSPDTVISTNFISRIYDYILSDKYEALLAPAVRLTYLEDFLSAIDDKSNFENRDYYKESRLVQASLNNLHREAKGFYFNNSNFLEYQGHRYPTTIFFDDPFKTSLIGFGMSWFMMAIDTSKIDSNRQNKSSQRLTYETIDAGFVGELLRPSDESTDYILDSCESFIVSWDQGSGHDAPNLLQSKNSFNFSLGLLCFINEDPIKKPW
jgi:hypothetical protein